MTSLSYGFNIGKNSVSYALEIAQIDFSKGFEASGGNLNICSRKLSFRFLGVSERAASRAQLGQTEPREEAAFGLLVLSD